MFHTVGGSRLSSTGSPLDLPRFIVYLAQAWRRTLHQLPPSAPHVPLQPYPLSAYVGTCLRGSLPTSRTPLCKPIQNLIEQSSAHVEVSAWNSVEVVESGDTYETRKLLKGEKGKKFLVPPSYGDDDAGEEHVLRRQLLTDRGLGGPCFERVDGGG